MYKRTLRDLLSTYNSEVPFYYCLLYDSVYTTVCIQLTVANVTSENEQVTTVNIATKKLCIYSVSQLFESSSLNLASETR